jgi:hypothetical protein
MVNTFMMKKPMRNSSMTFSLMDRCGALQTGRITKTGMRYRVIKPLITINYKRVFKILCQVNLNLQHSI